ncbi:MAG: hypothetical protein KatS3mg019_1002 [Fimbriimonadales bacterium]|nr:MAG: hypothetical protein KatS3mg019_1002 [Fimbriimonadales bacterium]
MVGRNKWLWFWSILATLVLLCLIYLFVWTLYNYQSTEVVETV